MTATTARTRFRRSDRGPCCALCGKLPSTVALERQAIDEGGSSELAPYVVTVDDPEDRTRSVLWVGWVCANRVHGDLANTADEGRRVGWYSH